MVDDARIRVLLERRRAAELATEDAIAQASICTGELVACQTGGWEGWRPSTVAALVSVVGAVAFVLSVYVGARVAR